MQIGEMEEQRFQLHFLILRCRSDKKTGKKKGKEKPHVGDLGDEDVMRLLLSVLRFCVRVLLICCRLENASW